MPVPTTSTEQPEEAIEPGNGSDPAAEALSTVKARPAEGPSAGRWTGPTLPPWASQVYLGLLLVLLCILYAPFVRDCIQAWRRENSYYSYGFLIPLISAGLVWLRCHELRAISPRPSNWGFAFVVGGLAWHLFANYIYMQTGVGLSLVLVLMGLVLCLRGWATLRCTAFPIAFLLFAVPLSPIFTEPVSIPMRLMSTNLAVDLLNAAGVQAQSAGMFMQFPNFKLVVPNACSGMQSLLALFAALAAFVYVVEGSWWKKAILLACIPPLVVFANSIRLALTGLTATGLSQKAAQGTVHETTGILVFIIACLGLLIIARAILGLDTLRFGGDEEPGEGGGEDLPPGSGLTT